MEKKTETTSILSKHLKTRQWRRNYNILISNITAVHVEIKPSFLWDVGPSVIIQTVANLISDLKDECGLNSNVFAIKVEEDIFVVNLKAVICNLKSNSLRNANFIDVSKSLAAPLIVSTSVMESCIKPLIRGLLQQLELFEKTQLIEKKSNYLILKCNVEWSVPCLFGVILNYPFIYWSNDSSDNCLSNWPLCLSKVSATYMVENFSHLFHFYSFSTPNNLKDDEILTEWFKSLTSVFESQANKFFSGLKLSTKVVKFPILVL